jgi:release factor glutamine methyltransferase
VLDLDHKAALREPPTPLGARAPQIRAWAERRLAGEPVSRILGRREFWGLEFVVTPAVLDPRPDTETIVAAAVDLLGDRRGESLRILDLGVGSGVMLCAALSEFPAASGVGLDRSAGACAVARLNAARLGFESRCRIERGDWTSFDETAFDLVVANPPYIPTADIESLDLEVRRFDPRESLDGGSDGLNAYREIAARAAHLLAPDGLFLMEVGIGQSVAVANLLQTHGLGIVETRRDLAGTARAVAARWRAFIELQR